MCEKNDKKQTYSQLKEVWDRAREMIQATKREFIPNYKSKEIIW